MAVFFRMGFGGFGPMLRGMFMMPTGTMRMMRGFLVIACLMVFGSFLMMPCGVLMMFRCTIMLLGGFRRHAKSPCKGCCQHRTASAPRSVAVQP